MDYHAEQDMELEALEAILMDDVKGANKSASTQSTLNSCDCSALATRLNESNGQGWYVFCIEIHDDIPEGWPSGVRCFSIAINPETEGAAADTSEKECEQSLRPLAA